jgi:hypothetical protein
LSHFELNGRCEVSPVITQGRKKKRRIRETTIGAWSGSFNPRNRVASELTSHSSFVSNSFVPFAVAHSLPSWVLDKLAVRVTQLTAGKLSVWIFDKRKSIVILFQTRLGVDYSLFTWCP